MCVCFEVFLLLDPALSNIPTLALFLAGHETVSSLTDGTVVGLGLNSQTNEMRNFPTPETGEILISCS